jgi:hypothetical protein
VTKKIGMNTPNPTASSLRRKSGWVSVWSRSIRDSRAPGANAPRIVSRPTLSASATNPISSTNAALTLICAVVS